jgi:hypothetical protein
MPTEKVIKLKVDNADAVKDVDQLTASLNKTDDSAESVNKTLDSGTDALDKFTKGGVSAMKGLYQGAQTAIGSMKTLKGAIISTGIGALVVVVASLAAYFTQTERGGDKLNVIMGAMGAVIGKLTDVIIHLGEKIVSIFENPKKALEDFGKLLKENITNRVQGLLEYFPALGKAIGLVLKGQFKEAGKVAVDAVAKVGLGVENITDKIGAAGEALVKFGKDAAAAAAEGARISNILNDVEDAERELIVQRARANKQIIQARFIADDLTKSTEERIAAVQRASKLEEQVATKELKYARQKAKALEDQAAIAEVTEDQLVAIAEAQARVLDLEADSIRRQKRLQAELKSLRNEEKTQLTEIAKIRDDAQKKEEDYQKFISQVDKELIESLNLRRQAQIKSLDEFQAAMSRLRGVGQTERDRELAQIEVDGKAALDALIASGQATIYKAAEITAAQREAERKVNEKYDKLDKQREMAKAAYKLDLIAKSFGALSQLAEAFSKDDEKNAEKSFKINKALRLGEAIANTASAIMAQLSVGPAGFVPAAIAAATGAAQIATIAKSKFDPGKTTAEAPTMGASAPPAAGGGGFTPNISFTGIGQNPLSGIFDRPMQAYVVNQQMNNNNMLERRIRTSANFGG